jgi:hypothetical protein
MTVYKATHRGYLKVAGREVPCAVLENGKRVISQSGLFDAFDRTRRGSLINDGGFPSIVEAKNLQSFITNETLEKSKIIKYYHTNGKIANGYDAELITEVCGIYIDAKERNVLLQSQVKLYERSVTLLKAMANVGITALIDEATGYQHDRESQALQKLLEQYISKDLMKWQKRFPNSYYKEIFKLHGWEYDADSNLRPGYVGTFTNRYVYDLFPKEVMDEIKKLNPAESNFRKNKYHQYLTPNIGVPQLDKHISKLIAVMKLSKDIYEFEENFKSVFEEELSIKERHEARREQAAVRE